MAVHPLGGSPSGWNGLLTDPLAGSVKLTDARWPQR